MQNFRPLPRFDGVEEAVPARRPPAGTRSVTTTDTFPTVFPDDTGAVPGVSVNTTGRVPILLLSGSHPGPVADQLAALAQKSATTAAHPTLTAALQATMGTTGPAKRLVVIPADKKQKKSAVAAPARHLKPRVRHMFVLLATLAIAIVTLITLVPLSASQNGSSLLDNFGNWVHSAQMNSQIQAHMSEAQEIDPNPANLPLLHIPNSPYVAIAEQDAVDAGISPIYFVRQIDQESSFNPNAVSVTNAEGIAQFEPSTASGLGIDPFNPVQALNAAAQMMARYASQYGDYAKALGAYNAGSGTLQSAENACGVNWLSCMPEQSQNYVYVIMGI